MKHRGRIPDQIDADAEFLKVANFGMGTMKNFCGFECYEDMHKIATAAAAPTISRVMKLAAIVGIDEDVIKKVGKEDMPALLLPEADHQQTPRIETLTNFGKKNSIIVKPNGLFIKQAFLVVQAAYADSVGMFNINDSLHVKREALGYTHRFGAGLVLFDRLQSTIAPGRRIFSEKDRERGRNSFAGFIALNGSSPARDSGYSEICDEDYINKFPGWAREIREIIQKHNPNRATELNDMISLGLERPMTLDEVQLLLAVTRQARRPLLTVVK